MGSIDGEAAGVTEEAGDGIRFVDADLKGCPTTRAMDVTVLLVRSDMELRATVHAVVVAQVPELLKDIERPIDGRRDRRRVDRPAALDEFGARDVFVCGTQDLD